MNKNQAGSSKFILLSLSPSPSGVDSLLLDLGIYQSHLLLVKVSIRVQSMLVTMMRNKVFLLLNSYTSREYPSHSTLNFMITFCKPV